MCLNLNNGNTNKQGNPVSEWAPEAGSTQSEVQEAQPTQVATPVYTNYEATSEYVLR